MDQFRFSNNDNIIIRETELEFVILMKINMQLYKLSAENVYWICQLVTLCILLAVGMLTKHTNCWILNKHAKVIYISITVYVPTSVKLG